MLELQDGPGEKEGPQSVLEGRHLPADELRV